MKATALTKRPFWDTSAQPATRPELLLICISEFMRPAALSIRCHYSRIGPNRHRQSDLQIPPGNKDLDGDSFLKSQTEKLLPRRRHGFSRHLSRFCQPALDRG